MRIVFVWMMTIVFITNCYANVYIEIKTYDRIVQLTYWDENLLPNYLKLGRNDSTTLEYNSTDFSMIDLLATFPIVSNFYVDVITNDSLIIEAHNDRVDFHFKNVGKLYRQRELFDKKRLLHYEEWKTLGDKNSKIYISKKIDVFWKVFKSSVDSFSNLDENNNWLLLEEFKAVGGSAVTKAENGNTNSKEINNKIIDTIIGYLEYEHLINNPLAVNFLSRLAEAGKKYNSRELTYYFYYDYFKYKIPKSKAKDIILLKMSRYLDSTEISKIVFRDSTYFFNWNLALTRLEENMQKQRNIALAKSNNFNNAIRYTNENIVLDSLLKAYLNKPVLIDIWASWCSPCIEEFKNYPDILAKYADKVHFLFISIDKNHDSWKTAHAKYMINNKIAASVRINFFDGKLYIGGKIFEVATVPRYILLNKNSTLIDSNAPKPSDPLFIKLIDSYID
jgi:thiol-disulfide isomerase/thioredoxin